MSSLQKIKSHLHTAHEATEAALNCSKAVGDQHLKRAHVGIGAAMAAGLSGDDIDAIAGQLTEADADVTRLVGKLSGILVKIAQLGSL